jgi:type I restriction-modification system DNA methylase subunit
LTQKGIVKTIYDPACGKGGMLSVAEEYIKELNLDAKPVVFGQELNPESYAICKSDMLNMIAKMKRNNGGSRIAIVFNGSPLKSS